MSHRGWHLLIARGYFTHRVDHVQRHGDGALGSKPPAVPARRLASQRSISMPLNVIHAVREVAARDQETRATVAQRLHDGQVRRCGDLAGAMMDQPSTIHPPTCGLKPS